MKKHLGFGLSILAGTLLTSCVQSGFSYEDIDTTMGVEVDSLTVPLNLDVLHLKTVLDLDPNSVIKEVNGEYAVVQDGTFESNVLHVPEFTSEKPQIAPVELDLVRTEASAKRRAAGTLLGLWAIDHKATQFAYEAHDVSRFIVSIDKVESSYSMSITLDVTGLPTAVKQFHVEGLQFQLPKGMIATPSEGTYDPISGVLDCGDVTVRGGHYTVSLQGTGVNFKQAGIRLENHIFKYSDEVYVKNGRVAVYNQDVDLAALSSIPENIHCRLAPEMSAFTAKSVDGVLQYNIDGIDINDISLSAIPKALNQTGTNINLNNPQLYIEMNNPLGNYGVSASFGIGITQIYDQTERQTYRLDRDTMTVATGSSEASYAYCLSPKQPQTYYGGFEHAQHVAFSGLGKVIAGERIPDALRMTVYNPHVWKQAIKGLRLGEDLGRLYGKYQLYTPLELTDHSVVLYTDTLDGWYSEDVELIQIDRMTLRAKVSTDLPLSLEFSAVPIDKEGRVVQDASCTVATVAPRADQQMVVLELSGKMQNIDGLIVKARAASGADTRPLAPEQYIDLKDLKVNVKGKIIHRL